MLPPVACSFDLVEYKPGPVLLRPVGFLACPMHGSGLRPAAGCLLPIWTGPGDMPAGAGPG